MFAMKLKTNILDFSKTHNCKVKPLPLIEKSIIRATIGDDPTIPETIYNRIQNHITKGENVNAILKWKTEDNNSYWTISRFEPSVNNNFKSQFSVSTKFTSKKCIGRTKKLYNTLLDIEKGVSLDYADKYLEGFLEEKSIEFNELPEFFS